MSKEFKELVEPSIVVFGYMLEEAIRDGWRISQQWPVNLNGGQYVVNLERGEDEIEEAAAEEPVVAKRGPKPKAK